MRAAGTLDALPVRGDGDSPRARGVLFTLSRPKGLRVGPIVEKCAEFRNPFS